MKNKIYPLIVLFCCILTLDSIKGQDSERPIGYNVIKLNPTPMLLWNSKDITLSYERIFKKHNHQSIEFLVGYLSLPSIFPLNIGNWNFEKSKEKFGINLCVDYRFYLKHHNRQPAPDGVYISVFTSYYGYKTSTDIAYGPNQNITSQLDLTFGAWNFGAALGYQFIFFKHFSLDLILLGPSLSYYTHKFGFSTEMEPNEKTDLLNGVWDNYSDRLPLLRAFLNGSKIVEKDSHSSLGVGFRYCFQIGYHF